MQSNFKMNQYNLFHRFFLIAMFLLLSGCSIAGGAFGTSAPAGNFTSLPNTVTPEQASYVSEGASSDPRIIADMQKLARQDAGTAYLIGPSDLLAIKVFQAKELSGEVRVNQKGSITLPLLGNVRLAGLSQEQAERRLEQLLGANLLQNPQVSIFIKQFTSKRFTIEGEVVRQGVFPIKGELTILQGIALAGGFGELAKTDSITLFRKDAKGSRAYYLDINLIREGKVRDPIVMNDDRIVVPRFEKKRVTVEGEIRSPGVRTFTKPTTVLQIVALSGGLTTLGAPNKVVLFRRESGSENAYGIDLSLIRQGSANDPFVQNGDKLVFHRSNSRYWLNQVSTLLSPLNLITGLVR